MATYKLIQDIEAEDHILGPLSLRQFIFALIAVFLFYLCFLMVARVHAPFLLVVFLPPALFFAFFALPFGRDQPTEIWALAKLRYWFKPRQRIWNQEGVKDLVTITVPKKIEPIRTKGLSENEVDSRLRALATTLDTRGWAVKNVNMDTYATLVQPSSERLIDIGSLPQSVPDDDFRAEDDVMDAGANPVAQQFSSMIDESSQSHRQELMDKLNDVRHEQAAQDAGQSNNYWFVNDGQPPAQGAPAQMQPSSNMGTLQPVGSSPQQASQAPQSATPPAMTPTDDPAILSLANNDDLNVSTLAREAKRAHGEKDDSQDEVVVPLR